MQEIFHCALAWLRVSGSNLGDRLRVGCEEGQAESGNNALAGDAMDVIQNHNDYQPKMLTRRGWATRYRWRVGMTHFTSTPNPVATRRSQ